MTDQAVIETGAAPEVAPVVPEATDAVEPVVPAEAPAVEETGRDGRRWGHSAAATDEAGGSRSTH